jgi:hypothetical protein
MARRVSAGRHNLGTKAMQGTGNLAAVMKVMGHRDPKTAMKYQHADLEQVGMAVNGPDAAMSSGGCSEITAHSTAHCKNMDFGKLLNFMARPERFELPAF